MLKAQADEIAAEIENKLGLGNLIQCAEKLLEWCPTCSEGSSGHIRQENLRAAIQKARGL